MARRVAPPKEHYENLGRLSSQAALTELYIGQLGWSAMGNGEWSEDLAKIAGHPGQARRLLRKAVAKRPDIAEALTEILERFEAALARRHHYAHGVLTIDPTLPPESQWIVETMHGEDIPLLTGEQAEALILELREVARIADLERRNLPADPLRTMDEP